MTWRTVWTLASTELVRTLRYSADSWHEFANTGAPAEAIEQDFALGELPHAAELVVAIDEWTSTGQWPEMSDGTRHCVRMRLNAAATFVFHLFQPDFLPLPPAHSEREILRWFLTAWWDAHGRRFFARQLSQVHSDSDPEDELE